MSSRVIKRPQRNLPEDPRLLSPPTIEPPYRCATVVQVKGYVDGADIEVRIDATTLPAVPGGSSFPHGVTVPLPGPLNAGQQVRARQRTAAATSAWAGPVTVKDQTQEYPAGPPRPEVNPAPVYRCGIRTGVSNLLVGGNVWITADGVEVGRVDGCSEPQGVNVAPAYGPASGQQVRAWFELCGDPSSPSVEHKTIDPPSPLPAPTVDANYETGTQVLVGNVVNGAKVTLYRAGALQGTWPCWGGTINITGLASFASGELFEAEQTMCPGDPASPKGSDTVEPCSSLPAPGVGPVQAGDDFIVLTQFVPGATIKVWLNSAPVGVGSGPFVGLTKKIAMGDVLIVVQDLAGCKSQYALEITIPCVNPPVAANPAWYNIYPVGWSEYAQGAIKGIVFYPAEDDGKDQPFHKRLGQAGRVPIVFMAHGNHSPADPSYLGYGYFQHDLAQMGILAVSVDCNALNDVDDTVQNIEDRADLIIDHIAHFQGLDGNPASVFHQHIDFGRVGLMGHSRGGDAVVTVPTVIGLAGVTIKAVLALAPTNFRFWFGLPTIVPAGYAFQTILPAGDGDVHDNNGAQFYDQAQPGPFKSQVYVHFTNHNFFNRQWLDDDSLWTPPQPAVVARAEHERVLSAYGCALYRATLLGHGTNAYLANEKLPAGVMTQNVHLSYQRDGALTVNNHEDGNTINTNSLGQPTTQTGGMSADEFPFGQDPFGGPVAGAFNGSFYGESVGMVVKPGVKTGRIFRSALKQPTNLSKSEVWIRAAEVTDGSTVPAGATGFQLGLEDKNGVRAWVDVDQVGGLPRPYDRNPGMIKTMLQTLRFKGPCFRNAERFDIRAIQAILIKANRNDQRALAFDDLQIVKPWRRRRATARPTIEVLQVAPPRDSP